MGSQDLFKPAMDVRSDHYSMSIPFNCWDLFLNVSSPEKLHQTAMPDCFSVKICQDFEHADPKDPKDSAKNGQKWPVIQIVQMDVGQNGRPNLRPQMWMSSLVFTIHNFGVPKNWPIPKSSKSSKSSNSHSCHSCQAAYRKTCAPDWEGHPGRSHRSNLREGSGEMTESNLVLTLPVRHGKIHHAIFIGKPR